MIIIDGAQGEGGGQIVRSSLALSILTGQAVSIVNLRAGRDKPGLRRQHLTAVHAAARICRAEVTGAELGSTSLTFQPGPVQAGAYSFDIGTAGSTSLVLQTVLLPLLSTGQESLVTLQGGTHNPLAPTYEFLDGCYFPALRPLGWDIQSRLLRPGFYPAGGGEVEFTLATARPAQSVQLLERGPLVAQAFESMIARLPRHVAERECAAFLELSGWPADTARIHDTADSLSPGNVLTVELAYAHVTEIVTAFGQRGVPAEAVAAEAWTEVETYLASAAPVGVHLADQLLLPLGWLAAGGLSSSFRTLPLSLHSRTHLDILRQFLPLEIVVEPLSALDVQVTCQAL